MHPAAGTYFFSDGSAALKPAFLSPLHGLLIKMWALREKQGAPAVFMILLVAGAELLNVGLVWAKPQAKPMLLPGGPVVLSVGVQVPVSNSQINTDMLWERTRNLHLTFW